MGSFDLYGVKEVADVTFWDTKEGKPVLYLDTLKVSTIEETAEQTEARGGKGNAPLIIWDYGKEITLTLEDALFSMKSMAIMHGVNNIETVSSVQRTSKFTALPDPSATGEGNTAGVAPSWVTEISGARYFDENGVGIIPSAGASVNLIANNTYIVYWDETVNGGQQITISSENFPGTYRITGDTYARNQATGVDEFFQFVIPLAKVNPEQTITMQADGDPSTFSMTVRVLRPTEGGMIQFIKYPQKS